jgi:hypothetical protein
MTQKQSNNPDDETEFFWLSRNLKVVLAQQTLTELSRRSNIPIQTLHNWAAGAIPRDIRQVRRLAVETKLSMEQLCFEDLKSEWDRN